MKRTIGITILLMIMLVGCTLEDVKERGPKCENVEAMMLETVILKSKIDSVDSASYEKLKYGFDEGYCAYDYMICVEKSRECTISCEGSEEINKEVSDGTCRLYRCENGVLINTGEPCKKDECQDDMPAEYKNNPEGKCIKTICIDGKRKEEACEYSCLKEQNSFIGCGECINGDEKIETSTNETDPDKQYKCTDGLWEEIEIKPECESGYFSFQNNSSNLCVETKCQKGFKIESEPCQTSCLRDEIKNKYTGCGVCLNNTEKCENKTQYKCEDGVWKETLKCTYECSVETNLCEVCLNESIRCFKSNIETCIDHSWTVTKECPLGCSNSGECFECENGIDRCENSELQTCINGTWSKIKTCSNGCNGDTCNPPKIPAAGDLCSPDKFEEVCIDGYQYYCKDNHVRQSFCDEEHDRRCVETVYGSKCSLSQKFTDTCTSQNTYIIPSDTCENGQYAAFLCDKDIHGNNILLAKSAPEICLTTPNMQYMMSCDSNKRPVRQICKSCTYDASGKAICATDDTTTAHKLGDPCSDSNAKACDGDILIQCNGAKYVAVHTDEEGKAYTCSQVYNKEYYCDELREISYASCATDCSDKELGDISTYKLACQNNLINTTICEIGQSGKHSLFYGFYKPSICQNKNQMATCMNGTKEVEYVQCPGGCKMSDFNSAPEAVCSP